MTFLSSASARARSLYLGKVKVWVFDLDNTLYPSTAELFAQVDHRMGEVIARTLDIGYDEARRLQKEYFHRYGTTLRGLMDNHGVDPHVFLDHVHQVDTSRLEANPRLCRALARIAGKKIVYTNSTVRHARAVLDRLGLAEAFDDIHDIVAANFIPKPDIRSYRHLLTRYGIDPSAAALVDDVPRNLEPAHELGMTTVLVRSHHEWAQMGSEGAHIHHVAEDLTAWLEANLPEPPTP
jgi:putative hydrolase of the HAD superfamily